jgi:hypothetical protein
LLLRRRLGLSDMHLPGLDSVHGQSADQTGPSGRARRMIASQLSPFVTPSSAAAGLFAIPALAVALHRLSIEGGEAH